MNELGRDLNSWLKEIPGFFLWVLRAPSSAAQLLVSFGSRNVRRLAGASPWILLSIFLIAPLYLVAGAFAIRSGVFDLSDRTISGDEFGAVWAFLGAGVAAAATLIGALLTERAHVRSSKAQALESVVAGLNLIGNEGAYAPKAQVAGALATLVHLGHPLIAMRTLAVAWEEGKVDNATACWLIDETLRSGSKESKNEAAALVRVHAPTLTYDKRGQFDWPNVVLEAWPADAPFNARDNLIGALAELVLSRDIDWWHGCPSWPIVTLELTRTTDPSPILRQTAQEILLALLSHLPPGDVLAVERPDEPVLTVDGLKRRIEAGRLQSIILAGVVQDVLPRFKAFFGSGEPETPAPKTD